MRSTSALRCCVWIIAWIIAAAGTVDAASIKGVVTDDSGTPMRGVLVTARVGATAISRYTNAAGAYRIDELPQSLLKVSTLVFGFESQTKTAAPSLNVNADFRLQRKADARQLTSADILTVLPQNAEVRWLTVRCVMCHGLTQLQHNLGSSEEQWAAILGTMTQNYGRDDLNAAEKIYAAQLSAKYFGPAAAATAARDVGKVVRPRLSDAALDATYYEMDLPTPRSLPHSIVADNKGSAWIAEFAGTANRMAKWNFAAQTVEELPLKIPLSGPHTPTIDHQGKVWTALIRAEQLTVIDPLTSTIEYIELDLKAPHTLSTDAQGNLWGNGTKIFRVEPQSRRISYFETLTVPQLPKGSWAELGRTARSTRPHKNVPLYAYHAVADSKGIVWYTSLETGWLVRLDPQTGRQNAYKWPEVPSSRGVMVDVHDNIWFANWGGHSLAKFDPRTEKLQLYKLPTTYAMPYSVFEDKARGYIWTADYAGNQLARLDPRNGDVVEFPLPTPDAYPRFISVDDEGRVWFTEWWQGRVGLLDTGVGTPARSNKSPGAS